jgi:hypothetical protein
MLEENKIMADALRKIGEIAVPPDATLRLEGCLGRSAAHRR